MENFTTARSIRNSFNLEDIDKSYEEFISALREDSSFETSLDILLYNDEDPTGGVDQIDNKLKRAPFYKNICHFYALGGLLPKFFLKAQTENRLFAWSERYGYIWGEEVLGLEYMVDDLPKLVDTKDAIVLIKPNKYGKFDSKTTELLASLKSAGVTFITLNDLYIEILQEAEVTVEDVKTYFHNLGGKEVSPNKWEIRVIGRNQLEIEYDPQADNWIVIEGFQRLTLRNFHAFNGLIPKTQKHTAIISVVNYLVTGKNVDDFKGRKAYLSDVFQDIIYVGFSHNLLDNFNANKLGNLSVNLNPKTCFPLISKSRDLIGSAYAYEEAGHSVFMHKGAKYLVVDAEGAFFTRIEKMTYVAWQSDKRAKITGRNLFCVATAGKGEIVDGKLEVTLDESKVYSRDLNGNLYNFSGIEYFEAAVASPLVEEGSGQGLGHPETTRTFVTKTKVKAVLPIYVQDEEELLKEITVVPVGTKLDYLHPVITQKSILALSGKVTIAKWESLIPGIVVSTPEIKLNDKTNTVEISVEVYHVQEGDAEKYRGFCKYRSNGGFLKNITVYNGDELIFNPNLPLHDNLGNLQQVEHCIGGEEYKTLMFVISLLASKMPGGKAIWSAITGDWENKSALEALIQSECKRVTVTRWGIEDTCYQMLKATYGEHPDFEFNDEENEITHSNAMCWTGVHVNIVEVPLTGIFVGKTKLFAEHIAYLGTEYPQLYKALNESIKSNQDLIATALDIVEGHVEGETDENPYGNYLLVNKKTQVVSHDRVTVSAKIEEGINVCPKIHLENEYNWEFFTELAAILKKNNTPGFIIEGFDKAGKPVAVLVPLDLILRITGTMSHKVIRNLIQILIHLETELEARDTGNWSGKLYRYICLLLSSLEDTVINSNSLTARATKTKDVAFTCRAGTTIDASVGLKELHINHELADVWGIDEGDTAIIGRVPVPGAEALTIVLNDAVPFGTAVLNAATKHAIEEGDSDGDSMVILVIDQDGNLKKPSRYVPITSMFVGD